MIIYVQVVCKHIYCVTFMRINLNSYDRIQWPVIFFLELRKWTCKLMLWTSRRRWFLLVSMEQVKNHCFLPLVWEGLMKFHCFFWASNLMQLSYGNFWKNPSRFFSCMKSHPVVKWYNLRKSMNQTRGPPPTKKTSFALLPMNLPA